MLEYGLVNCRILIIRLIIQLVEKVVYSRRRKVVAMICISEIELLYARSF